MLLGLILNGLRRYQPVPPELPQMATNSTAISAACHRPGGDTDAYLFPVGLGVVDLGVVDLDLQKGPGGIRRIAFSADTEIEKPRDGLEYQQPVIVHSRSLAALFE